jgi:hypothetical protein
VAAAHERLRRERAAFAALVIGNLDERGYLELEA